MLVALDGSDGDHKTKALLERLPFTEFICVLHVPVPGLHCGAPTGVGDRVHSTVFLVPGFNNTGRNPE